MGWSGGGESKLEGKGLSACSLAVIKLKCVQFAETIRGYGAQVV